MNKSNIKFNIPYGKGYKEIYVPKKNLVTAKFPKSNIANHNVEDLISNALKNPIGSLSLDKIVEKKNARTAIIVINDITRPTPTKEMLNILVSKLRESGLQNKDITILVATGNHSAPLPEELDIMIGGKYRSSLKVVCHNASDNLNLIDLGYTSRKVPIVVNKAILGADLKVLTGTITPHHAAGFSGGRKSILPGISGLDSLRIHHSFPIRSFNPVLGWYEGNPFHEESLEAARKIGIDFIVNSIPDSDGKLTDAVAGDLNKAHEKGVEICRMLCQVKIPEKSDITIVSPGGYPRDINLHQAQKAISFGEIVTKKGGIIILVAECSKGIGKFKNWLMEAQKPEDVILRFKKEGYTEEASSKAFMIARALIKYKIFVVSEYLEKIELQKMFIDKKDTLQKALDEAFQKLGKDAKVLIIPKISGVIPSI